MTTKEKKIAEQYEDVIKSAEEHFKELHNVIDSLEAKLKTSIHYLSDNIGTDESSGNRRAYQLVYGDDWLDHCPGEYLTREEDEEWFDNQHDRYICSGDPISNANNRDIMEWQLQEIKKGVQNEKSN